MLLPGSLRATTLGDVLGGLHRQKVTGVLEIIDQKPPTVGRRHRIHLEQGLVAHVETPLPVPPIGEVLVQQGMLSARQHGAFEALVRLSRSSSAGELLLRSRLVSRAGLRLGLAAQMRMRIDAVFEVRDASLRFHPRGPASGPGGLAFAMPAAGFLHGRPRARDRRPAPAPRSGAGERARRTREALAALGLAPGATLAEVRQAFRRLAASAHPDLHATGSVERKTATQARFAELSRAYHLLVTG
jgi:DnaJ-domain-containing protein 1